MYSAQLTTSALRAQEKQRDHEEQARNKVYYENPVNFAESQSPSRQAESRCVQEEGFFSNVITQVRQFASDFFEDAIPPQTEDTRVYNTLVFVRGETYIPDAGSYDTTGIPLYKPYKPDPNKPDSNFQASDHSESADPLPFGGLTFGL